MGSGSSRTYEMARRFVQRGHEVHIVTSDTTGQGSGKNWATDLVDGMTVHSVSIPYSNKMGFAQRIKSFIEFALQSSRMARHLRGDLVFATSTPLTVAIPGIYASVFRKSPLVFEVRDLWPAVPIAMGFLKNPLARAGARALENIAYRTAHSIVALSPDMKEGIIRTGIAPEKITVVPNAADLDTFQVPVATGLAWRQSFEWLGDRPMVLYCGTLGVVNNVEYLVNVARYMTKLDPEVRFVIVGSGNREEAVAEYARTRGVLGKNFFMLDPVAKIDVPPIFSAADVTVSTVAPIRELYANSANKFFDSLAAGRPILINHGGWQESVLAESGAGFVLNQDDPESAAKKLLSYLRDEQALQAGKMAALALGHERFSRDELATQLLEVLERAHRATAAQ